jgi:hypothetical protein
VKNATRASLLPFGDEASPLLAPGNFGIRVQANLLESKSALGTRLNWADAPFLVKESASGHAFVTG